MKTTLKNTTISFTSKRDLFIVKKGKGTGTQMASFKTMDECIKFDEALPSLIYRTIFEKLTGRMGGAYFYNGTDTMFDDKHPFFNNWKNNYNDKD